MCIAAIIREPISAEYLNEMEKDNPHGGGVAWVKKRRKGPVLCFKRGLTAAKIFEMQQRGTLTLPYMLHFRWATHGEQVPELTHPFPLGKRALFGELSGIAPRVLIHNGIWRDFDKYLTYVEATRAQLEATSDTAIAAYLIGEYPVMEATIMPKIAWATAIGEVGVDGLLSVVKYGSTWCEYKGNEYSNLQWLPSKEWFAANRSRWSINDRRNSYYYLDWDGGDGETGAAEMATRSPMYDSFKTSDGSIWKWNGREYIEHKAEPLTWDPQVEPFADDLVVTASNEPNDKVREALEVVQAFDGWEDYVRARYGDEIAEAVKKDAIRLESTVIDDDESLCTAGVTEVPDDISLNDIVSDDPEDVNKYLAQQFLAREALLKKAG